MTAQPIEVGDLVLTASRRTARVVRLDEARGEATVERLDDGERVAFRVTWLLMAPSADVCTATGQGRKPWVVAYLLESLQRAGFAVRTEGDRLVVEPPPGDEIGHALQAELDRHRDALLAVVREEAKLDRILGGEMPDA